MLNNVEPPRPGSHRHNPPSAHKQRTAADLLEAEKPLQGPLAINGYSTCTSLAAVLVCCTALCCAVLPLAFSLNPSYNRTKSPSKSPIIRAKTVSALTHQGSKQSQWHTYLAGGVLWSALELDTRANQQRVVLVFFRIYMLCVCLTFYCCCK